MLHNYILLIADCIVEYPRVHIIYNILYEKFMNSFLTINLISNP